MESGMNLSPIRELLRELRDTKSLVAEIVAGRVPHDDGRLAFRLFGMDATLSKYDRLLPPTMSENRWENMSIEPSKLAKMLTAEFSALDHVYELLSAFKNLLNVMDLARGVDRNASETINIAASDAAYTIRKYEQLFGKLPSK